MISAFEYKDLTKKMLKKIKENPAPILYFMLFVFTFVPSIGFGDINSAFMETKSQIDSVISNKSGLFWIFMAVILGGGVWALYKGSWKGIGIALLLGLILGNFSGVIDTVLNTKIVSEASKK